MTHAIDNRTAKSEGERDFAPAESVWRFNGAGPLKRAQFFAGAAIVTLVSMVAIFVAFERVWRPAPIPRILDMKSALAPTEQQSSDRAQALPQPMMSAGGVEHDVDAPAPVLQQRVRAPNPVGPLAATSFPIVSPPDVDLHLASRPAEIDATAIDRSPKPPSAFVTEPYRDVVLRARREALEADRIALQARARQSGMVAGVRRFGGLYDGARAATGRGRAVFTRGGRYSGAWSAGAPDGYGVWVYADGSRYEGLFAAGRPTGTGAFFDADGERLTGSALVTELVRNADAHRAP